MPITVKLRRVKWYKRGAYWSDGSPRMCVQCAIETKLADRKRRNQAVVVAVKTVSYSYKPGGNARRLPVGYCFQHIPEELMEGAPEWVDTESDQ